MTTDTVAFLDTLQHRTFNFFWERTPTANGLTPDRWPTEQFSSIAAVGFALTAYPVGVERAWITRQQAADRTLATLRFFWTAPQDSAVSGATGYHGFFYHFLNPVTGQRYQNVELSTIDTALLSPAYSSPNRTSTARTRPSRKSAASPTRSTAVWTGSGSRHARPSCPWGGIRSQAFLPTTGAATTRR